MATEYTVSLHDTVFFQMGVHTVVKNAPFVIHVVPQSNASKDNKVLPTTPPSSVSSLKLIYSSPPTREVAVRNSSPIEFTEHQATNKDGVPFLAVEVRLFVLSSQHEGESFKVIVTLEGGCELVTEPIKCVSKQAKVVNRSPPTPQNGGSLSTHNNNNNNNNTNHHHTTSQTPTQSGSPSRSPTASTQTHTTSHSQTHTQTRTHTHAQQSSTPVPTTKKRDILTTRKRAREADSNEKALKRIVSEQQTQRVLLELLFKQTQYIMACIAPTLTPPSSSSPSHNTPAFESNLTGELAFSEMVFDSPKFFSAPLNSSGNTTTLVNLTDYSAQSQQQQQQQQSQQQQQQGEEQQQQHGHGVNSVEIADYGKTDNECDINREGSSSPPSSPYSSLGDYFGDMV